APLLDRALARKPTAPALRKELAGVLGAAGRHREGIALYSGLTLTADDRYQLAGLHAGARDYEAALRQCQLLLKDKPDDRRARRLHADVLSWAGRYKESLAVFERLRQDEPGDEGLEVRVAEVTLWSGDRPRALSLFQDLLAAKFE